MSTLASQVSLLPVVIRPVPALVKVMLLLCCIAVGLSAIAFAIAAVVLSVRPIWLMFGFELVTLVGAIFGLLFCRGKFQDGQALALCCVAATFFVGAVLSYLSVNGALQTSLSAVGISLKPYVVGRSLAAALLIALAAAMVLTRTNASRPYLWRALLTGLPILIVGGAAFAGRGALASALSSLPGYITIFIALIAGLVAVVLISGSLHCLIRAFEFGRPTNPEV